MRDIAQLCGAYEVSRTGFHNALDHHNAVVLVPGGQREMVMSISENKDIFIDTKHRGFVREAMRASAKRNGNTWLVPLYSFGETEILDNVRLPVWLQSWFIRLFRANVLFFPYGAFYLPGCPRAVQVSVLVCKPISVPPVANPTKHQVELLHRRYMTILKETIDKYKTSCDHGSDQIVFDPPLEDLAEAEFETLWKRSEQEVTENFPKVSRQDSNVIEVTGLGLALSAMMSILSYMAWG